MTECQSIAIMMTYKLTQRKRTGDQNGAFRDRTVAGNAPLLPRVRPAHRKDDRSAYLRLRALPNYILWPPNRCLIWATVSGCFATLKNHHHANRSDGSAPVPPSARPQTTGNKHLCAQGFRFATLVRSRFQAAPHRDCGWPPAPCDRGKSVIAQRLRVPMQLDPRSARL